MRDAVGRNFTTKEVKFGFRKVCAEFTKRLDPDLPFYYHTSSHTRYYEGPLPDSTNQAKEDAKPEECLGGSNQPHLPLGERQCLCEAVCLSDQSFTTCRLNCPHPHLEPCMCLNIPTLTNDNITVMHSLMYSL